LLKEVNMGSKKWVGVGGGAWSVTDAACKRVFERGLRDVHCVSPDLSPRQWEYSNIKKYGMTASYDNEIATWVNIGMNVNTDINWMTPQLQAIKNVGWQFFATEGQGRGQANTLRSVQNLINYGSEDGANMYAGMYNHEAGAHFANLMESYHKWALPAYRQTAKDYWSKCKNFGLTLMMYPADLETDIWALKSFMDELENYGINISELLLWSGVSTGIERVFENPWIDIVRMVEDNWGLRTDTPWAGVTPTPPTPPPPAEIGNPIASMYLQLVHGQPWLTLNGHAWDANGKAPWGRWTGLWRYDETMKSWKGINWQKVGTDGKFNYVLTNLLPKGVHVLRIQTNDGIIGTVMPIEIY
jgi:hypothetical protein